MTTFLIAVASFFGFILAYHTYGRLIARKIFQIDPSARVPSREFEDGIDFVPTPKSIVFGHHFTSIAGTGPIVGPAIAVFWGWLPALLWVVVGSIFIGAVHDFGSLIVSMRNRGQTVGETAGRLISPRAKLLFLFILFFSLIIVLAIFGLVIAVIFKVYPETVLSVWIAMPLAMLVGYSTMRLKRNPLPLCLISLALVYAAIYVGVDYFPVRIVQSAGTEANSYSGTVDLQVGAMTLLQRIPMVNPTVAWTIILMVYCFFASVLPVWLLLQPRDYINSQQLLVALVFLVVGLGVATLSGRADLLGTTPAVIGENLPAHTPPIFPFLFITVACGACSGFHCLVSSGTSSKQVASEGDAQLIGYGSMLMEGALAVIVILACTAGVGMGLLQKSPSGEYAAMTADGTEDSITGAQAWRTRYKQDADWEKFSLADSVGAFVEGGANFLGAIGLPLRYGVGVIATLVACFAATTLDSATRLQRYVIQELAGTLHITPFRNKYLATLLAVSLGLWLAVMRGAPVVDGALGEPGKGGTILWPLFGATNQLLAGLALMVVSFYLWRRGRHALIVVIPMLLMLAIPAWAMATQLTGWWSGGKWLLFGFGLATLLLQMWMILEAVIAFPGIKRSISTQDPRHSTG